MERGCDAAPTADPDAPKLTHPDATRPKRRTLMRRTLMRRA
jgi:hypothetical protein